MTHHFGACSVHRTHDGLRSTRVVNLPALVRTSRHDPGSVSAARRPGGHRAEVKTLTGPRASPARAGGVILPVQRGIAPPADGFAANDPAADGTRVAELPPIHMGPGPRSVLRGHFLTGGVEHPPHATLALAVDLAGRGVVDVGVERPAVQRDLLGAVRAGGSCRSARRHPRPEAWACRW